jgi:hypothetical protein
MAKTFDLSFHGTRFTVPKELLFPFFNHHPDLNTATSYDVKSNVQPEIFEVFVTALATGAKVSVTNENMASISLLAKEFWFEELVSEYSDREPVSVPEVVKALSERISKLEHDMSSSDLGIALELKESITSHDQQLERLFSMMKMTDATYRREIDEVRRSLQADLERVKSKCENGNEAMQTSIRTVERQIGAVNQKIGTIDQKIGTLDQKLGIVDQKIRAVDPKIETILIRSLELLSGQSGLLIRRLGLSVRVLELDLARVQFPLDVFPYRLLKSIHWPQRSSGLLQMAVLIIRLTQTDVTARNQ